jgi:hypothetical protein
MMSSKDKPSGTSKPLDLASRATFEAVGNPNESTLQPATAAQNEVKNLIFW